MKLFKQAVKRLTLILLGLLCLVLLTIVVIAVTFFFNPTLFINPKNLDYALTKTHVLKSWSWKTASIHHEWISWNKRKFYGGFSDLCLLYDNPDVNVDTCLEEVSWNVELRFNFEEGFKYDISKPLVINSSKLIVRPKDNPEETPPPDLMSYWDMLWNPLIPDLDFTFKKIDIVKKDKPLSFDLKLMKTPVKLNAEAFNLNLEATKDKILVFAPKKILLPFDLKTKNPLYFSEIKLEALVHENDIPVTLTAKLETAVLNIKTKVAKTALKENLSSPKFLKQVIQETTGSLEVSKLRDTIETLVRPPYNILPAPINAMEGALKISFIADNYKEKDSVLLKIKTELDMAGPKQELRLALNSDVPFILKDNSIGPIAIGVELKKVTLLLPKLSRTKLPPQLIPDSRFKSSQKIVRENLNDQKVAAKIKKAPMKKDVDINMHLQAIGNNIFTLTTNLLDEPLRMNFDLQIENGEIARGYVQTLPLTTTVFKRKIVVQSVRVIFNAPMEPEIVAKVEFHLPEYKITLDLEGPMSKPRQGFSSQPPLPLDDIYAVILFGRPLEGLDPADRSNARSANQILSQGILSLAVLYYFAGSPVESLGYNPTSNELSAQIGLGSKTSLRVGGSGQGLNSTGIRRSLGKGWYIDSSVSRPTTSNGTGTNDYGVLLERIISY